MFMLQRANYPISLFRQALLIKPRMSSVGIRVAVLEPNHLLGQGWRTSLRAHNRIIYVSKKFFRVPLVILKGKIMSFVLQQLLLITALLLLLLLMHSVILIFRLTLILLTWRIL